MKLHIKHGHHSQRFCSWCIVKPLESKVIGLRIFACDCYHSISEDFPSTYSISFALVAFNLSVLLLLTYLYHHYIVTFQQSNYLLDFDNRCIIVHLFSLFGLTQVLITSPLNFKIRVIHFEMINSIMEEFQCSGLLTLRKEDLGKVKRYNSITGGVLMGVCASVLVIFIVDEIVFKDGDYLQKIILLMDIYVCLSVILLSAGQINVYKSVVMDGIVNLKESLANQLREKTYKYGVVREKCAQFLKLYSSTVRTAGVHLGHLSLFLPVAMVCILFYEIIQFSLLVEIVTNKELSNRQVKNGIELTLIGVIVFPSLLVLMRMINDLKRPVEDLISFLIRLPLSRFSSLEISQVEDLIHVLSMNKPEANIADLFTVGSEMIASVGGIIVTYLLIVMQFRGLHQWE